MKKNMGKIDRIVRALLVLIVIGLYYSNTISGTLAVVLLVGAAVFLFTSFVGWCGVYSIFGITTCKVEEKT